VRDQSRLFIASDANTDGLLEIAWKAARKPARGGTSNLICIAEPLDALATELQNLADEVTVVLPWGSLLRAVALPGVASLLQIASLCLAQAHFEVVLSFDRRRDAAELARLGLAHLHERHINSALPNAYEQAGLHVASVDRLPQRELMNYETTWAKRLAISHAREVWRLRGVRG